MQKRRVIRRSIRSSSNGIDVVADLNAEVAINIGESGRVTRTDRRNGDDEPKDGNDEQAR